jgi:peptidoglycan/xylan/chitin deacetylase (PgdA/CDA1 family)
MRTSRPVLLAVVAASLVLGGCFGASPTPSPTPTAPESSRPTPSFLPTPSPSPIPSATLAPSPTGEATPTAAPSPTTAAFVTYTVRAGDTLGSIAAAHATTWQSLVYWNREAHASLDPENPSYDPNHLAIGWILRLIPGVVVPYDAPLPAPAPSTGPAPTPGPSASGTLVTNGRRGTDRVALTFDMGGRVGDALAIMTWLRDHGVKATIFMTGDMAESSATDAGRLVLARVDARPDLFDLGNHSNSHPHMTALTVEGMKAELTSAEAAIERSAASSPRPFFRPPYGEWNTTLVNAAASVGYPVSVMWDVDTIDWNPISEGGPTAQQMVENVLARTQGGSIVLMHLGGYETLAALPGIVSGLRADGFRLVTLGEMLG